MTESSAPHLAANIEQFRASCPHRSQWLFQIHPDLFVVTHLTPRGQEAAIGEEERTQLELPSSTTWI